MDTAKGSGHWSPRGNIFPVSNVIPWAGHGGQVQGSFPRVFHCEDLHKTHHTDLLFSPQRWLKGAVFLDLGKNTFYLPGSRLPISLDPTLNSEQGKQPCNVSQRKNPNNLKSHLFSLLEHFLKSCFLAFFFLKSKLTIVIFWVNGKGPSSLTSLNAGRLGAWAQSARFSP